MVAVVAADADDFGWSDGGEEVELGERFGVEVGSREGLCGDLGGEVFFWSFEERDGPEGVVAALLDEGVSGDWDAVLEGEEFTLTHGRSVSKS